MLAAGQQTVASARPSRDVFHHASHRGKLLLAQRGNAVLTVVQERPFGGSEVYPFEAYVQTPPSGQHYLLVASGHDSDSVGGRGTGICIAVCHRLGGILYVLRLGLLLAMTATGYRQDRQQYQ